MTLVILAHHFLVRLQQSLGCSKTFVLDDGSYKVVD